MNAPAAGLEALLAEALRQVVREEIRAALRDLGPSTLSTEEAAQLAKRSTKTVQAWVKSGQLPATRRGRALRIRREDLERFLAGGPGESDPILATLKRP